MTRRTTRVLWSLIGICLFASIAMSLTMLFGLPDWARSKELRQLEVLIDIMALLFWMLIFAFYWANKK
jgi:hypothetical protein